MPKAKRTQFRENLLEWSVENTREFPWRQSGVTRYEMLMAEFFLARTRASVVARVFPDFIERFPNLGALRDANESEIADVIRPTGLQNRRAQALKELAATLEGDEIPDEPDELKELPRVGDYVANATLTFGENEPLPILDTNVRRIYRRIFGDNWPDDEGEQWELSSRILPDREARQYNLALLDFGSEVCSAQAPSCEECFAREYCCYYQGQQLDVESK